MKHITIKMKPFLTRILMIFLLLPVVLHAGIVEKTWYFTSPEAETTGHFTLLKFPGTRQTALPGEPSLPWCAVAIAIPPGEKAIRLEVVREQQASWPQPVWLYPGQPLVPVSMPDTAFISCNAATYGLDQDYPSLYHGQMLLQYQGNQPYALVSFTPVSYHPALRRVSWYKKVTIKIHTITMEGKKPGVAALPADPYDYLIISPFVFRNEFQPLINLCAVRGMVARVVTIDSILATTSGFDTPEKIRNFVIGQYQCHQIKYLLLAGNPALVPCRYLHCSVQSTGVYYDSIPSDLYFSALDGTFDANGNRKYGEIADSADLLPELSAGRFPVNDTSELRKMIRKTISYQINPVMDGFSRPLLAGEYLYNNPVTFGSDYLDLLIGDHSDNGYFTHGIPPDVNQVETLYDSLIAPPLSVWQWNSSLLLTRINQGNSFLHHTGHANVSYMMRLSSSMVTNANFSQVNGIIRNFQLLYTHGCNCGAFDYACIAAKAVKIDNFLVAGIFNSRYGWFNQGTTEGPSHHLHREFVSALYRDTLPESHFGSAHMISKQKTAPWVGIPGEFEPGAQRWCHFGCNVLGDPALTVYIDEPDTTYLFTWTGAVDSDWHKAGNWDRRLVPGSLCHVVIPATVNPPVLTAANPGICHDMRIEEGANVTVSPGRTVMVHGTLQLLGNPAP